ncbi:hypothetical protein EGW08_011481 [Elysia chlorotica]|uniref:Uncharacterized protein n=1 Tax=Elysia chlorotica TaxID=188477 RepID=A0A3S1A255_ELYCH|nr:hypothetical protein EGW08_011481 [Elysia chlorotica]
MNRPEINPLQPYALINPIFIDGVRKKNAFVLLTTPVSLESIREFWQFVDEYDVISIVDLGDPAETQAMLMMETEESSPASSRPQKGQFRRVEDDVTFRAEAVSLTEYDGIFIRVLRFEKSRVDDGETKLSMRRIRQFSVPYLSLACAPEAPRVTFDPLNRESRGEGHREMAREGEGHREVGTEGDGFYNDGDEKPGLNRGEGERYEAGDKHGREDDKNNHSKRSSSASNPILGKWFSKWRGRGRKNNKFIKPNKRDRTNNKFSEPKKCDRTNNKFSEPNKCDQTNNKFSEPNKCDQTTNEFSMQSAFHKTNISSQNIVGWDRVQTQTLQKFADPHLKAPSSSLPQLKSRRWRLFDRSAPVSPSAKKWKSQSFQLTKRKAKKTRHSSSVDFYRSRDQECLNLDTSCKPPSYSSKLHIKGCTRNGGNRFSRLHYRSKHLNCVCPPVPVVQQEKSPILESLKLQLPNSPSPKASVSSIASEDVGTKNDVFLPTEAESLASLSSYASEKQGRCTSSPSSGQSGETGDSLSSLGFDTKDAVSGDMKSADRTSFLVGFPEPEAEYELIWDALCEYESDYQDNVQFSDRWKFRGVRDKAILCPAIESGSGSISPKNPLRHI